MQVHTIEAPVLVVGMMRLLGGSMILIIGVVAPFLLHLEQVLLLTLLRVQLLVLASAHTGRRQQTTETNRLKVFTSWRGKRTRSHEFVAYRCSQPRSSPGDMP